VSLQRVIEDVENERLHQEEKWGVINDDHNTLEDWSIYMQQYLLKASGAAPNSSSQRQRLLQVAALAVAAVESFDRNCGFPVPELVR
jgi:hypothetical protein